MLLELNYFFVLYFTEIKAVIGLGLLAAMAFWWRRLAGVLFTRLQSLEKSFREERDALHSRVKCLEEAVASRKEVIYEATQRIQSELEKVAAGVHRLQNLKEMRRKVLEDETDGIEGRRVGD